MDRSAEATEGRANAAGLMREVRRRMGITQQKLAMRIGVALPTVSRWETGRSTPSPLAVKRIMRILDGMGEAGRDLANRIGGRGNRPARKPQNRRTNA